MIDDLLGHVWCFLSSLLQIFPKMDLRLKVKSEKVRDMNVYVVMPRASSDG